MGVVGRREREKRERRQAILEAAAAVFLEKGPSAASMDEIADRAELSKGTLYLYFSSKEDLFVAVSADALDYLASLFRRAVEKAPSGLDAIKWAGCVFLTFLIEHPGQFRMAFLSEAPAYYGNVSEESLSVKAERKRECEASLMEALRRARDEGALKPETDVRMLGHLIWAHTSGVLMLFGQNLTKDEEADLERLLEASWQSTMCGVVTSPELLDMDEDLLGRLERGELI